MVEIDRRLVGSGNVGPLTLALQRAYFDVVRGVNRAFAAWLQPVYERPSTPDTLEPSLSPADAGGLAP